VQGLECGAGLMESLVVAQKRAARIPARVETSTSPLEADDEETKSRCRWLVTGARPRHDALDQQFSKIGDLICVRGNRFAPMRWPGTEADLRACRSGRVESDRLAAAADVRHCPNAIKVPARASAGRVPAPKRRVAADRRRGHPAFPVHSRFSAAARSSKEFHRRSRARGLARPWDWDLSIGERTLRGPDTQCDSDSMFSGGGSFFR